jgi:hypothetical protein
MAPNGIITPNKITAPIMLAAMIWTRLFDHISSFVFFAALRGFAILFS